VTIENLVVSTVKFVLAPREAIVKAKVKAGAVIVDAPAGEMRYDWATGDAETAGGFVAEWEVTRWDATIETLPNGGYLPVAIVSQAG
jgi:hypothetical protein